MTLVNRPLVSILINNYNYGRYVGYCIESCISQTYDNIEIIIYDDQSTDNSVELITKYADKVSLLKGSGLKQSYNAFNQANAINCAFSVSKGNIVCLLDSDDTFSKFKVEKVVEAFQSNPSAVLVQHPFYIIDEFGGRQKSIKPDIHKVEIKKYIFNSHNLTGLFSQTSGLSFRKSYLQKVLPIEVDDYVLVWPDVRLSRQSIFYGDVITIFDPLGYYRTHPNNDSKKLENNSFYDVFIAQLYDFFNSKSAEFAYNPLHLYKSIVNPKLKSYRFYLKLLFTQQEPIRIKLKIFINRFKSLIRWQRTKTR